MRVDGASLYSSDDDAALEHDLEVSSLSPLHAGLLIFAASALCWGLGYAAVVEFYRLFVGP